MDPFDMDIYSGLILSLVPCFITSFNVLYIPLIEELTVENFLTFAKNKNSSPKYFPEE